MLFFPIMLKLFAALDEKEAAGLNEERIKRTIETYMEGIITHQWTAHELSVKNEIKTLIRMLDSIDRNAFNESRLSIILEVVSRDKKLMIVDEVRARSNVVDDEYLEGLLARLREHDDTIDEKIELANQDRTDSNIQLLKESYMLTIVARFKDINHGNAHLLE